MTERANGIRTFVLPTGHMSVDHSTVVRQSGETPVFLSAKSGDVVIVWDCARQVWGESTEWWMGQILWVEGGARNPKVPTLFQISDIDTGVIRWVNADQVQQVMLPMDLPISS